MNQDPLQRDDDGVEEFRCEVNVPGRSWIIEGDFEQADQLHNLLDKLVKDYGRGNEQFGDILLEEEDSHSWRFTVANEDLPELSEKLDKLEDQEWVSE